VAYQWIIAGESAACNSHAATRATANLSILFIFGETLCCVNGPRSEKVCLPSATRATPREGSLSAWMRPVIPTTKSEDKHRKIPKYLGLDVHQDDSIIAVADGTARAKSASMASLERPARDGKRWPKFGASTECCTWPTRRVFAHEYPCPTSR